MHIDVPSSLNYNGESTMTETETEESSKDGLREQCIITYWNLSKVFRGRMHAAITVHRALELLRDIILLTDPDDPLHKMAADLQDQIVKRGANPDDN